MQTDATTALASRAPARTWQLDLLGGWVLRRADVVQPMPLAAQRALAYVALKRRTTRRQLARTLWPDATEERGAGNLRSLLWRLQKTQIDLVSCRGDLLALAPDVDVDVHVLQRSITAVLEEDEEDVSALAPWELLPGWYDDWVLLDRERLRQARLHAWESLAWRLLDQGRCGAALEAAMLALESEPLRESPHRLVISIHLTEGNLNEAVRQYRRCSALLRDELGLGPSTLLTGLLPGLPDDT